MDSSENNNEIRVRFAPSPTGYLHVGGVRTALFNWLFARHNNGKFILRIEDTDTERSTKESIDLILESMKWCGLDWDEGPFLQTDRTQNYEKYITKLLDEKKAYRCYCTTEDLDKMRKEAMTKGEKPKYDGRCLQFEGQKIDKPHVVRFKTPKEGELVVRDLIKGDITFDNAQLDDLIIMRSNGSPTYNFVVVIDDAEMNITHVIRGDDHIANTPRQVHLYKALGLPVPQFAHLPMILGQDKARLSKRHGASSVLEYRQMGYLPEALINYLARLGWSHGDQEIFSEKELIEYFDLGHINKSAAVFNPDKLLWLNTHYIKNLSSDRLAPLLKDYLVLENIISGNLDVDLTEIKKLIFLLRERSKTLVEMAQGMEFYFKEVSSYDEKGAKKFFKADALTCLTDLLSSLNEVKDFSDSALQKIFNDVIEKRGVKLGKIAQPVRLALTGKTVSPGIFDVILLLGKGKVVNRLNKAVEFIKQQS